MAWAAELKRRGWHCINGCDMIRWYNNKMYDEWYESLTDEEKSAFEERKALAKERKSRRARASVSKLLCFSHAVLQEVSCMDDEQDFTL